MSVTQNKLPISNSYGFKKSILWRCEFVKSHSSYCVESRWLERTLQRSCEIKKTNSFSMMIASSSRQTQLGESEFLSTAHWTGNSHGRSIVSYILCEVSLRVYICFVSSYPRVRFIHVLERSWWFDNHHSLFLFQEYAFLISSVESSLTIVTAVVSTCLNPDFESRVQIEVSLLLQESTSSVYCVSSVRQISSTGIGMSERENRDPPDDGDDDRGVDHENDEENDLIVTEVHPDIDRSTGLVIGNDIHDDTRLLDKLTSVLSTIAIGRRRIPHSRYP